MTMRRALATICVLVVASFAMPPVWGEEAATGTRSVAVPGEAHGYDAEARYISVGLDADLPDARTSANSVSLLNYDVPGVAPADADRLVVDSSGPPASGDDRHENVSPLSRVLSASTTPCRTFIATYNGGGIDRTFTHFTDEAGAFGITGTKPLAVGDSVEVGQLSFGKGQNNFLANAPGDNFVTDLPATASTGQLNGIGVFGPKQQYAISFSEADAFASGVRVQGTAMVDRGIYTIQEVARSPVPAR